ncbi:hypothetical protein ACFVGM_22085 [Kitasatospora purpeofusca]|uniref:hypothetical protein n=1 Tax=Kitasatospora purpeofusca TaxID=67352 RepID=UPI0033CD73C0
MSRLRATALALGCTAAALTLAATTATVAQAAPGDIVSICANQYTPAGWVDIAWANDYSCGGGTFTPNRKTMEQVAGLPIGTSLNVCASAWPPAGWTQVSEFYSQSCRYSAVPSLEHNSWRITRVY